MAQPKERDLDQLEREARDLKAKVIKLVEEIEPRAARRERLRGVVSPKKLQEFDAVSHRIRTAIRELKEAVRKRPRWPVN